jgi:hypothetical protein
MMISGLLPEPLIPDNDFRASLPLVLTNNPDRCLSALSGETKPVIDLRDALGISISYVKRLRHPVVDSLIYGKVKK